MTPAGRLFDNWRDRRHAVVPVRRLGERRDLVLTEALAHVWMQHDVLLWDDDPGGSPCGRDGRRQSEPREERLRGKAGVLVIRMARVFGRQERGDLADP